MTNLEKLQQIRAYALTCRAAVVNEDAMTAIELAGCTAAKVNEVVDLVNQILDYIEKVITSGDIATNEYDETRETLII